MEIEIFCSQFEYIHTSPCMNEHNTEYHLLDEAY